MERGRKWLERGRREGRVRKGEWRTMRGRTGGWERERREGKGEGRREAELIPHHEILPAGTAWFIGSLLLVDIAFRCN